SITSSQTLSAVAIDPAGNPSAIARFEYRIPPGPPAGASAAAMIPVLPIAPGQRVQGARAAALPAVHGLAVAVLHGHGLRLTMRLGRPAGGGPVPAVRGRKGAGGAGR